MTTTSRRDFHAAGKLTLVRRSADAARAI